MPTPLYNALNGRRSPSLQEQFDAFKRSFNGDPQQFITQAVQSGRISQAAYQNAVREMQNLRNILK